MLALAAFIMVCVVLVKVSIQDIYRYKQFLGEGEILEYLQALIFFTSAWVSWLISKDLHKHLCMRWYSLIYAIIALAMLFVGFDKIAWRQILFGWKTPENIAAVNAQNQITLHNLEYFQNYLDLNLFLVSVAALMLVLWRPSVRFLRPKAIGDLTIQQRAFLMPRYFWPLFLYAASLSYFVATESETNFAINIDQEWPEFLLFLAASLALLKTYILLGDISLHRSI